MVGGDEPVVLVVDPHSIFRLGIATCLESLPLIGAVVAVATVAEAMGSPELPDADLAIVDSAAPDVQTFVSEVRSAYGTPSLVSGAGWTGDQIAAIVDAGAVGVLAKESLTPATLEANVSAALHGAAVLPRELMARVVGHAEGPLDAPPDAVASQLSVREQQVLRLIADGHATRDVAAQLCYSERTIKNVLHDVATKLGARSRSHAVAHAVRAGLI
jgi:DNA-binding NarL/FixJ family response regulator